jgi:uncharacterized protein YuzE
MQLKVAKESDALYFRLNEKAIVDSEEMRPNVILDYGKDGQMVGVEFGRLTPSSSRTTSL